MKISVIITSYKRPSHLKRCLTALLSQQRPADEVLVVAREGDQETIDVVSAFRHHENTFRSVRVAEPGVIAALNCGVDSARGDLLVFTDDDSQADTDWLERIDARFSDETVGAVGGRDWLQLPQEPVKFRPSVVENVGIISWYGKYYGNHHCPLLGHTKKVMFLKGVNLALRRSALGSHRIDTCLQGSAAQPGWEIDLCLMMKNAGFDVIFDDRILVKHYCAPRLPGDNRDDVAGPVFSNLCFNNHYVIAKHLGIHRSLAYLCNSILLGSRRTPGLLASAKWILKGDKRVLRRLWQMTVIALKGFRAGRQVRNAVRRNVSATFVQVN